MSIPLARGQLQIMVNNGDTPNEVEPREAGVYAIEFVPVNPGVQQVDVLFNDEAVPGTLHFFFSLFYSSLQG